ncbi:MAG TPA: 3-hydroxyacyl-CoA dehydrogenase family protein [Gemmatimonadales bacterium]|nr:3-hydroxyacyl-CoA dehydrogenase family protein [Gemmatimonadales bacterium]
MSDFPTRVAVIGAGTMGAGIAQAAATAGWPTTLTDARPEALQGALDRIARTLDGAVQRGKLDAAGRDSILGRLRTAPDMRTTCQGADLVIEAVLEDLDVKRDVMSQASDWAEPSALLATNTSSISIADIAADLPRPERLIGMHFFNPVHLMKLVEIVVHDGSDEASTADALAVVRAMGKEPIVVRDSPGFASSRLGVALGLEAMRMLEEGVASAADIDRAMELGYNHPMGPLKLTDLVGLDVRLRIADYLHQALGAERFAPPAILRRLVAEGKLGKKSGHGFYDWSQS